MSAALDGIMAAKAFPALKRGIEVLMEASDHGCVRLCPAPAPAPVVLVVVDALWVLQAELRLQAHSFEYVDFQAPRQVRCSLHALHMFFRSCKTQKHVRWLGTADGGLKVQVLGHGPNMELVLEDECTDATPYASPLPCVAAWAGFALPSAVLATMLLDLTVGGTTVVVALRPRTPPRRGHELVLSTDFETGRVEHVAHSPYVTLVDCADVPGVATAPLIAKFFKLMSSIALLCTDAAGWVRRGHGLVINMTGSEGIEFGFYLQPFQGPRQLRLSPGCLQMLLTHA